VLPILLRRSQHKVFKQPASLGATQAAQLARSAQPLFRFLLREVLGRTGDRDLLRPLRGTKQGVLHANSPIRYAPNT
jgi:hypothetical protein